MPQTRVGNTRRRGDGERQREVRRALLRQLSNPKKRRQLELHFYRSNDCQAWGVNNAYEIVYSRHFPHSFGTLSSSIASPPSSPPLHGNKSAKTVENAAWKHMILGTTANTMASEGRLGDWLMPSLSVGSLIVLMCCRPQPSHDLYTEYFV